MPGGPNRSCLSRENKVMKKLFVFLLIAAGLFVQTGCGPTLKNAGASLVAGVNSKGGIDSLTNQAARGVVVGLTTGASKEELDSLISNLGHQLRLSTDSIVFDVKDSLIVIEKSLLGKYLEDHASAIVDTLTGLKLRNNLKAIVDSLLGKSTQRKLDKLIASAVSTALNTALSDSNRYKLNHLLDTLGSTVGTKVGLIVDTAVEHLLAGTSRLSAQAQGDLTTLQKHVVPLLIGAGALILGAAGLIFYFFHRKQQYAKLSNILTYQIHETKSDSVFNDLKNRISGHAKRENLEPLLRDELAKSGMLGEDARTTVAGRVP
jgi:hypothetical protein